ncbi:MAG: hypothetical protein LBH28_11560 [Oscillospiraceae bacterium]|jgi:hypothetical protein|nr:hypothetical protein [Oscillospiraceae bacterium]
MKELKTKDGKTMFVDDADYNTAARYQWTMSRSDKYGHVVARVDDAVTMMYKSPHWIYILQGGDVPDDEIFFQIDHSYDLIIKSLTNKARERLSANGSESRGEYNLNIEV